MSVKTVGSTNFKLQGLSTDDKPTDVENGATYHAIDTGEEYVFHDGTWEQDLRRIAALRAV